jgi:predicted nucleic acid-binding protein
LNDSFDIVELNAALVEHAVSLARKHALRAADALQLASALIARADEAGHDMTLVSSDLELNTAAIVEKMAVIDPTQT